MGLMERMRKNSTLQDRISVLQDSIYLNDNDVVTTKVPAINIAFSGSPFGGFSSGLTMIAGPSKHFKTAFGLLCMKSYMDKYEESICIFYDSEFGTPQSYFDTFEIDTSRVLHVPVTDLEELKFDIMKQVKEISRDDRIFIMIDSVGNLASKKEVDDAHAEKSAADMTRAKQFKSLFRMVTPHLTLNDIPMIVINHTYDTQEMYSRQVVSGGKGAYYSSDNIWIVGRQQEKVGSDLAGYNFIINIEKSRYVKEKSKIPINVSFENGLDRWSGLLDMAVDCGIIKRSGGWYNLIDLETGEIIDKKFRGSTTNNIEFWKPILKSEKFLTYLSNRYCISSNKSIMTDDDYLFNDK